MKNYMKRLVKQVEDAEAMETDAFMAAINKMSGGTVEACAPCAWCYEDDVEQWKLMGDGMPHPKDWPYRGIIVPIPDYELRGQIEHEKAVVIVTEYPVEKCYVECDWTALLSVLTSPDLHRFHIMEPVQVCRK